MRWLFYHNVLYLLILFQIYARKNRIETIVYFGGCVKGELVSDTSLKGVRENILRVSSYFESYSIILYADLNAKSRYSDAFKDMSVEFILEPDNSNDFVRTTRLGIGRTKVLNHVQKLASSVRGEHRAFLIVMDFDEVNEKPFNITNFEYVINRLNEWDAVSFNRKDYYDIWALRYRQFNLNVWQFEEPDYGQLKIGEYMKTDITERLKQNDPFFLPVYSAFNGFAMYKLRYTKHCKYGTGFDSTIPYCQNKVDCSEGRAQDCEHVDFHRCMISKHNAKVMIFNGCLSDG